MSKDWIIATLPIQVFLAKTTMNHQSYPEIIIARTCWRKLAYTYTVYDLVGSPAFSILHSYPREYLQAVFDLPPVDLNVEFDPESTEWIINYWKTESIIDTLLDEALSRIMDKDTQNTIIKFLYI